jgi:zinc protease
MVVRRTLLLASLATLVVTSPVVSARTPQQAPPKSQPVVMKGRAPVSKDVLRIKLPRPVEADLPNGLHLMVLEDRRVPQVSFQLLMQGAGGYFDAPELAGVSSVTAAMMREGTTTRNTQQIAELLETRAATLAVTAGLSSTFAQITGSSLTENFPETLGLAADVLLNPSFPQDELDRYKTRTRAGLVTQRTSPGFLANEMIAKILYGSHPASRVSLTAEMLDKITRDVLVTQHRQRFVPDHAVLAIAGDISMAEARKHVDKLLAAWKKAGTPAPAVVDPPAIGPAKVSFIARPNSVQTSLWVGTQGINRVSPDYDIVQVMNAVLGGGPTGRLFTHLREEKGYTYGASSFLSTGQFRGSWIASMDVRTEVTEPALRDLIAEITRMRDEAVPAKEFEDRKRGMVGSFALQLESAAAVLNNYVTRWMYKLPADYWDKYPDRVMAVTQAEVQAAAKKYLDPGRLQIVAVGTAEKIGETLKRFGAVETFDTNGRQISK